MNTGYVSRIFLQSVVLLLVGCLLVGAPGTGWTQVALENDNTEESSAPEAAKADFALVSDAQTDIASTKASESLGPIADSSAEAAALSPVVGQVGSPVSAEAPGAEASQQPLNEEIKVEEDAVAVVQEEPAASSPDIAEEVPPADTE